jgi:hypothetical protein
MKNRWIALAFAIIAIPAAAAPANFTTASFTQKGDALYYKTTEPLQSVEESYSFVYTGPNSIVEPFFVNAHTQSKATVEGFMTDLSASRAGTAFAGSVSYRYTDQKGQAQYVQKGRLRTEPYFYRIGHIYRVDAIADGISGLLTTRIYDEALGPQTFDLNIKTLTHTPHIYAGIVVPRGPVRILDFAFGTAGKLPIRSHPARRAADYINYLGYNAGVEGPATSSSSVAFQRYFPQLLMKHVRVSAETRFLPSLNAVAKYGIDADVLTGNNTTTEGLKEFISRLALPPDAIELWNEPNNPGQGAAHDPQYAVHLPPFAAQITKTYPHTKFWGPSVLPDPTGYPSDATKLSTALGSYITAWNAHSYTQGTPENLGYGGFFSNACGASHKEDCGWYGATNYNDNLSAVLNPTLPGVTTEGAGSYGSYPEICGHSNVDTATQQAYVERGMLYNFKLGHLRIYPYKFIDDGGCSDGFGTYGIMSKIVDARGQISITPKPAYVSLVYFDHLVADEGARAATFDPQPLSYAIDGATPDIEELLLAESDGTYRLILWSDKALWDFDANGQRAPGRAKALSAEQFTLKLAEPMTARVYTQTPGTGLWAIRQTTTRSTSIAAIVNQYPLIIMLVPKKSSARAITLPQEVPTPGPIETPRAKSSL